MRSGVVGSASWSHWYASNPSACVSCIAATAAGFVTVWSTIRLLMMRGSASVTKPDVCVYDVGCPPGTVGPMNMPGSASM